MTQLENLVASKNIECCDQPIHQLIAIIIMMIIIIIVRTTIVAALMSIRQSGSISIRTVIGRQAINDVTDVERKPSFQTDLMSRGEIVTSRALDDRR